MAEEGEEAELCIVNTCTVTQGADKSSVAEIKSLLAKNPKARLLVTGCLGEKLLQEGVDPRVEVVLNRDKEAMLAKALPEELFPEFKIDRFSGHERAFVKVQDGCNSFCSYCIIPYVRGRSRSRSFGDIVAEVEGLIAAGYKEVVLTGINIGDFVDGEKRLADLVCEIDRIDGLKRLRISSIDPDEVDDRLIEAVLHGKTTCPSLHLVLQSGSNAILKRMNRKYTRQIFLETAKRLRRLVPTFSFTTDVIVGFPGETESDFAETVEVIEEVQFAKVHMFPYSKRERTRAALFPHQIDAPTMQERKKRLIAHAEKSAFAFRDQFIGKRADVLIEGDMTGLTPEFLRVKVDGAKIGSIVNVELKENGPDYLVGVL